MKRFHPDRALLGALAGLCLVASAQDSVDKLPELSPEVRATVPAMNCPQPKIPERASMPVEDIDFFITKVNAYGMGVSAYIADRNTQAKKYRDLARAQADAGNAAVKEIGDYRASVIAFQEKHKHKK